MQLKTYLACWVMTYITLYALLGEAAAFIATTFFATALYIPVAVLHFLYRKHKLHFVGRFGVCWAVVLLALRYFDIDAGIGAEYYGVSAILALALFVPWAVMLALFKTPRKSSQSVLDRLLFMWTRQDPYTIRNMLDGGCIILGRPGSGKTSSSGRLLALSLIAIANSGGLILSSSPTDLAMWQEIFAKAGRSGDLIVFGPRQKHRFNLVKYLSDLGASPKDIAKVITTIGESRDNDQTAGGKDGDIFWTIQAESKLETAISILLLAGEDVSTTNIHKFIITAAQNSADLRDEKWKGQYHSQCFAKAFAANKSPVQAQDFQLAWDTWLTQWPSMNDRTRTSIETSITGTLHVFNSGQVWSLLSGETTITPAVMDQSKWVFVDMSVGQHGSPGAFVLNAWRLATQKYVTGRNPGTWKNPIICWADEAGKICNSADAFYLSESRKFGGASIFLAQSMQSFHAALPGERGKSQAEVLLGCFSTKILHAIGDPGTAEWASKLLGNQVTMRYGYGGSGGEHSAGEEAVGKGGMTFNVSEHIQPCLEPRDFMHNLRTGGQSNNYLCDAIIIRTGETFANGQSWLFRSFSQR